MVIQFFTLSPNSSKHIFAKYRKSSLYIPISGIKTSSIFGHFFVLMTFSAYETNFKVGVKVTGTSYIVLGAPKLKIRQTIWNRESADIRLENYCIWRLSQLPYRSSSSCGISLWCIVTNGVIPARTSLNWYRKWFNNSCQKRSNINGLLIIYFTARCQKILLFLFLSFFPFRIMEIT